MLTEKKFNKLKSLKSNEDIKYLNKQLEEAQSPERIKAVKDYLELYEKSKKVLIRLNKLLKKNNKTRKDLSRDLDIPYSTISSWFTRIQTPKNGETIYSIAKYLNTTFDYIVWGETEVQTIKRLLTKERPYYFTVGELLESGEVEEDTVFADKGIGDAICKILSSLIKE